MQEKLLQELLATAAQLYTQGELSKALDTVSRVLSLAPTHAKALNLRGLICHMLGDTPSAIESVAKAITSDPTQAIFFANLCGMFLVTGEVKKALEAGTRAAELDGENAINLESLANALIADNQYEAAHTLFEKITSILPTALTPLTQGLQCARKNADFTAAKVWLDRISSRFSSAHEADLRTVPSIELINLAYVDVVSPLPDGVFTRVTSELDRRYKTLSSPHRQVVRHLDTSRVIKIGYLSQNFGDNPIGHVTHDIFRHHDRSRFEAHVFSLRNRTKESAPFAQAIKEGCDHFHDLSTLSPRGAAQAIEGAGIDILIYLDGFMSPSGPSIVAQQPAPRQYFWLGHAGTLGLSCIDATIADNIALPSSERSHHEPILEVAGCYHCASPQEAVEFLDPLLQSSRERLRDAEAQSSLPFVFCGFNNPEKIDAEVFKVWMQILQAVPYSLLWLSNQFNSTALERNLRASAESQGVSGERLVFAGRLPSKQQHLGRHRQADLFLDTFSHTASTTALDALWMGLPIITLKGDRFSSRICSDFLTNLGIPELICISQSDYIQRAVTFAQDSNACSSLKRRVATAVQVSELFNPEQFVRKLEAAFLG